MLSSDHTVYQIEQSSVTDGVTKVNCMSIPVAHGVFFFFVEQLNSAQETLIIYADYSPNKVLYIHHIFPSRLACF